MINGIHLFFQEVLDKKRLNLLIKLQFFTNLGFFLAGGTALALQYGHRESIDFDFFINNDIDTEKLYNDILIEFGKEKIIKTYEEKNTLYIEINNIKISFMTYKYNFLKPLIKTKYINISSDLDIAAMKLWAIQNRATNKDYVDLYFILQKYSIEELIIAFISKFGNIVKKSIILKSLVYFDDVDEQKLILHKKLSFEDVKKTLEKKVRKY